MIKIRNANPKDVKEIQSVFYSTWLETYPNQEFGITKEDIECVYKDSFSKEKLSILGDKINNLKPDSKLLVAEVDNNIVGVCRFFTNEICNKLQAIYVLPEYQNQGIGKLFWKDCLDFFDINKKTIVQVAIYNEKAIIFYRSLGFEDNGNRFSDEKFRMPISLVIIPEMEMEIKK